MSHPDLPVNPADWPTDPYELLGVPRRVERNELKRAYTRLIRIYKPEHFPEEFRRLREAYEAALQWVDFAAQFKVNIAPQDLPQDAEPAHAVLPHTQATGKATASLDEQIDHAWRLACDADPAESYRRLTELVERYPNCDDLYVRLYWLLTLQPQLALPREPCDVLVAGLRATAAQSGPLRELYRREILRTPAEGMSPRCTRLLADQQDLPWIVDLAEWRFHSATQLKSIVDDLDLLRERMSQENPAGWLRLLLMAADELAWTTDDPDTMRFDRVCEEIDRIGAVAISDFEPLARFDLLRDLIVSWRSLAKNPFVYDRWWRLLACSWARPYWQWRNEARDCLVELTGNLPHFLQQLILVERAGPSLLSQFGTLLAQINDHDSDPAANSDSTASARQATLDFLDGMRWHDPDSFRPLLVDFCTQELISPEQIAETIDSHNAYWLTHDRHLADALRDDWPLRYTCLAHRLVRG